jgi:hypothetical protein
MTDVVSPEGRRSSARGRLHMMVKAGKLPEPIWAIDIGLGGLKAVSRSLVFPGTYLDLSFRLPGTRELLKVGAQVATLGDAPGYEPGSVTLGLRFCRVSKGNELSIYRFLDKRRGLWTSQGESKPEEHMQRPFEALLRDAYTALQASELRELGFVCTPWPQDLNAKAVVTRDA